MSSKLQILIVASLVFIGLFFYKYTLQTSYEKDIISFRNYAKQADALISLQNKWSNKEEDEKLIKSIKTRFDASIYRVEKQVHILQFDNLTKSTLNRLGKMLLNSNLTLKKIELKKDATNISLHVEVKI